MPRLIVALFLAWVTSSSAQTLGASRLTPNLTDNIERPLRYRPEGADFVIENGGEFFNRPLYGGNTAFRVDGGDKPEFVLYLPGRGGNLRFGLRAASAAKWLQACARVVMRYRPGSLLYEIHDPLLGDGGVLRMTALAYHQTEGLIVRVDAQGVNAGVELVWAYGGVNGQRGKRDGDIGTENVPISEWFQLVPEFCRDNTIEVTPAGFTLRAKPATIVGTMPAGARLVVGDAARWNDLPGLLAASSVSIAQPLVVGRVELTSQPLLFSLQRIAGDSVATEDLDTYRAVTADRAGIDRRPAALRLVPAYALSDLPRLFDEAERHFSELRTRVSVDTPDAFLNAAVGALNVAADAVWDAPERVIMHGAIAWRTKLLGWRGPYSLDALGWHDRARQNFTYWAGRQNTDPIPEKISPADESANLARNEKGLHTNGDISNSHYDMNLVFIDALFRHLRWTGDFEFAKRMWPVIERHLAWERRLFRREFGPEKLPLYEAYAAIWASDDLQYSGGGAMHASAYNYFHNIEAARVARLLKLDAKPYEREAVAVERGMRTHLWLADRGWFAESKDLLGLQRVHPSAALWTFYHTMDSDVPTPQEAWQMTRQVDTEIPHLPVRGPGVPDGLYTLATSNWMPYDWSINNIVMGEVIHTALGFWQAGRAEEAWAMTKGSLLAAMFMGISPGNVGSMSYLDVYRRESQRDFGDGSGVLSRALIEGLFGVRPDALAGELRVEPGFPGEWSHASLQHPDLSFRFQRRGETDTYVIDQKFPNAQKLRLRLVGKRDRITSVTIDGATAQWYLVENSMGAPRLDILAAAAAHHEIAIQWAGAEPKHGGLTSANTTRTGPVPARMEQGQMRWWEMPAERRIESVTVIPLEMKADSVFEVVDLTAGFNDRVTRIFKNEYRAPRSPSVSLAMPKQGIGGWAGGVNANADIDDAGLRATAAKKGGRIVLPNGVPLATPGSADAKNVTFVSQWDNYPRETIVPLTGRARGLFLLMAGSTNHMQSRFENGEIVVTYTDGTSERLALENPSNWWPIDQDYFIDDFQFARPEPLPVRVDLKTGNVRVLEMKSFKGHGGHVAGGAATVIEVRLNRPERELKSLTVRALANDVVIGLMSATLVR